MDYRRFGQDLVVRMDPDEEIIEKLLEIAEKEQIALASVNALGAVKEFTVGVFQIDTKKFIGKTFKGYYEIAALTGTLTQKDGKPYAHLHMSASNDTGVAFGGHLSSAVVSATCELVIHVIDGQVGRAFSEEIGLNLFDF
ncbi:MAG: DNA-binding protein [Lachnospiraceae bacterium]|nr:DNA-binding protein [Lachnospiraceae bacterium]